ncbi:ubiquinol-cytochrome c reductase iron-sulfur subunit [Desulfobulbus rhabdoformis]|jgi:cytochrome b6-f complex iron-sulfur subunit|uniref:ubiquinol-cytochrome c reductase iron-sulfur subunit n=1 Tax=Desulfobulbus rhabdoformis TaxID=34032 RepID=UPI001964392A|nr:ubiquinol-cytochrome c reductase iron-sulfur subunit [Desulfobulbus rhabdoformis]MBM9615840.1 ubiquinol-cytochrome c reductase iron-sulfur subunit [Desulfobulbus rhabdoformis]
MVANNPRKDSRVSQGRRTILTRGVQWLGALLAATILYPLLRFTGHKIPSKPRLIEIAAPLPLSGVHIHHDFLLFAGEGEEQPPHAVSRICTHLGCRVNYQEDKKLIECPCHQSRFTPLGVRISGPAEKNLPSYEVSLKKDAEGRITTYVVHL